MIFRDFVLKDTLLRFFYKLSNGYKLYAVGGIVRDYFLGRKSLDYDIVVVGNFKEVVDTFLKKYDGELLQLTEFGTAKIEVDDKIIDIAKARKEVYPEPGSLPVVIPSNNILEDLRRRDFTINAMAISLNLSDVGRLIDPFGGYEDLLDKKVLRVIKTKSFYEDPTRAFRGIRYKNRFGLVYSEDITKEEIPYALEILPRISFVRIKNELERTAEEEKRAPMFREIARFGLLKHLGKPVGCDEFETLDEILEKKIPAHWLYFTLLIVKLDPHLPDLRRRERNFIKTFLDMVDRDIPYKPLEIHSTFYGMEPEIALLVGLIKNRRDLVDYYRARKRIKIHIKGDLLVNSGIRDENIRKFLTKLFVKKWLGEVKSKEDELEYIKKWTP